MAKDYTNHNYSRVKSDTMAVASAIEQKDAVKNSMSRISQQSNLMKQCLSSNDLLQAFKHSVNFLSELRTSQLSPKNYYELYMSVFDSLELLSNHLLQSHQSKQKRKPSTQFLSDLYELVQYSGNIIPRLYMMICIGTTYMATDDAPTKDIMKDMIEMCRGVQHPVRGLFLRYYLSQRVKDLLPLDSESDFKETVKFLISNFIEMNKLWVRLQHQGHSSERELRYAERKELKILVGSNLVRLSQIVDDYSDKNPEFSSVQFYQENIFPVITEQIIQCRDHLAQNYLIDVLIQIFPVPFHFATLEGLLNDVFLSLNPALRRSELVFTLVDRFLTYKKFQVDDFADQVEDLTLEDSLAKSDKPETNKSSENKAEFEYETLFDVFWNFYLRLGEGEAGLFDDEHSLILQCIIKLTLTFTPESYDNLNKIYQYATEELLTTEDSDKSLWLDLLLVPIQHFDSIKKLLELSFFHEFYLRLNDIKHQQEISLKIIEKLLNQFDNSDSKVEHYRTTEDIDTVFKYLLVLIKQSDTKLTTSKDLNVSGAIALEGSGDKVVTQEFLDTQANLCKVLHLIENKDYFKTLSNLMYVRKKYLSRSQENIIYTYPTIVSKMLNSLRIAGFIAGKKKQINSNYHLLITSAFKNLTMIIDELYQHHRENAELVLKLYLNAAVVADQLKQESISYEFYTQCFIIYEENNVVAASAGQFINPHDTMGGGSLSSRLIVLICNKLQQARYFDKENYESLIVKLTLYGSKLLKKQDQCRSVYYCAHLWWWCDLFIDEKEPIVEDGENKNDAQASDNNEPEVSENNSSSESFTEEKGLYRDPKRVLECLQKSLRVADSCMDPYLSLKLFIEILNRCLIFSVYGNALIDDKYISGLIDLIRTNLDNLTDGKYQVQPTPDEDDYEERKLIYHIQGFFDRTLQYIQEQQSLEDRFTGVVV